MNVQDEFLVLGASSFGCMNASRHLLPGGRGVQLLHLLNKPPAFLVLCYELGLEKIVLRCRTL